VRAINPKTASSDFFGFSIPLESTCSGSGNDFVAPRVISGKSFVWSATSQPV
jgi:hypothetical protein